jgi:tetratricopeptide (TPR) repeat protein
MGQAMRRARLLLLLLPLAGPLEAWSAVQADPAAQARRGKELMAAGRYAEAVPVYRGLVAAMPGDAGLLLNLGMALQLSGASREAVAPLAAAFKLQPESFPAALFLGAARMRLGQARAAVAPLQKAVRLQGDHREARSLLIDALVSLGRHAQAEPQLVALSRLVPQDASVWFSLGRTYEALATRAFETLVERDPESAFTLALVADVRRDEGRGAVALDLYRKAIERAPGMRGLHAAVAGLERAAGHTGQADVEEEKERRLPRPDCVRAVLECRYAEGKHREVIAAASGSKTLAAAYWLARSSNQLAGEAFARLEALPPSAPLHEWRAGMLRDEGRFAESAEEWRKAIALAPAAAGRLRQELAVTLRQNLDLAGAQAVLEDVLREQPEAATASYLLGDVLLARQQPEAAIPLLETAVRLDPGLAHAHGALGRAYALVGRPADAVPHLEKALPVDEDGSLRFQLARAYRAAGRSTDAERALAEWERFRKAAADSAAPSAPELTPP